MSRALTPDPQLLLGRFLASGDADASEREFLAEIIQLVVEPIAVPIISRKLHTSVRSITGPMANDEASEIIGDVRVMMISALRWFKREQSASTIDSIAAYTATVTRNTVNEHLRKKFPERSSLANQLRYLLTHASEFRLVRSENAGWICGLSEEIDNYSSVDPSHIGLSDNDRAAIIRDCHGQSSLRSLVSKVLGDIGHAVTFADIVSLIAEIRGTRELFSVEISPDMPLASSTESVVRETDRRELLRLAWREIIRMPLRHRTALLLHFSDDASDNLLLFFTLNGVASIREIAEAVEMPLHEFAKMWNDLPLPDARIAEIMSLKRQQVINLRQSARNTLKRQFRGSGYL